MTDTMLKKILDAIIQNIWLQVLVLILAFSGLTLLIGASFEEVAPTSKGISAASGNAASSEDSSQPASAGNLDDFLNGSGAFGDWEDFSSFYVESNPVPSNTPSSRPSSSAGTSSSPSSETPDSPPVSQPEESPEETSSGESTPEEPSGPPAESSESTESSVPSGEAGTPPAGETTPGGGSSVPGGSSPMDAPVIGTDDSASPGA